MIAEVLKGNVIAFCLYFLQSISLSDTLEKNLGNVFPAWLSLNRLKKILSHGNVICPSD